MLRWAAFAPSAAGRRSIAMRAWAIAFASAACAALAQPLPSIPAEKPAPQAWQSLSPAQQRALRPLQGEWSRLDAPRRQKWLDIAERMPSMPPDEQARVRERMIEWAQLTPEDRGKARLLFQEAKQASPTDRRSKWEAYRALPDDEKEQLARQAATARTPPASSASPRPGRRARDDADRVEERRAVAPAKSNLVPNPAFAAPPKPVGPTVTQAAPGATTSLMSRRIDPPPHQQTGLPKIAATPGFVDETTLLPKRGPQAAAARSPGTTPAAPVPRP